MKCTLCKTGEMRDGVTTITLERDKTTLVIKDVTAEVCDQCEFALLSLETYDRAREMLNDAVRRGVQVEVVVFTNEEEVVQAIGR